MGNNRRSATRQIANVSLLLASVAISALILEGSWRLLRSRHYGPATNSSYVLYDEVLGWRYRPSYAGRHRSRAFDVAIDIDAEGKRTTPTDRDAGASAGASGPRIGFLGDSFTFGWGVEATEAFPWLVGSALQAEVLNFGVAGYSTDQQFLLFERAVLPARPDIIVLTYCANDLREILANSSYGHPKPRMHLVGANRLRIVLARQRATIIDRFSAFYLSLRYVLERSSKKPLTTAETATGRALIRYLIGEMASAAQLAGARFIVVSEGQPWLGEAVSDGRGGPDWIDIEAALEHAARTEGAVKIPGDGHWSRLGHRVVASELLAVIRPTAVGGTTRNTALTVR